MNRPAHLNPKYGAQFADRGVVDAYRHRPPYPAQVYAVLERLLVDVPRRVLELGCGLGEVARNLVTRAEAVDAVDPSEAMIAAARRLPGGDDPRLRWFNCTAEQFDYRAPYALVVAADSLHWMDWDVVLPAMGRPLSTHGTLALLNRRFDDVPWWEQVKPWIPVYSTNQDYQPCTLVDELIKRRLFVVEDQVITLSEPFRQSIEDYVESWHSRNGFSRERMDPARALEFDAKLRGIVAGFAEDGMLTYDVNIVITWGRPRGA
jgi:SAM-dependent methyltransferase